LHWIDTRDDLRLLRSIKYGVPGTAMTPWGDLTSSLQRMQLVIYIRSLSLSQQQRDDLFDTIYTVFDQPDQMLDTARVEEYAQVNSAKDKLKKIYEERTLLNDKIENGTGKPEDSVKLYEQELKLKRSIKQHEEADQILVKLKSELKKESQIYQMLG